MKTMLSTAAAALILTGTAALAVTAEDLIAEYRAAGYDWIEVKRGPTQIKLEAVRGTEEVEIVVDAATGAVLKRETERADRDDMGRSGVRIRDTARDFSTGRGWDDDDDDDDDDRRGRDDDDDDDRRGRGRDDDDDRGRGRGGDDD